MRNVQQNIVRSADITLVAAFLLFTCSSLFLQFTGTAPDPLLGEKRELARLPAWGWNVDAVRAWPGQFTEFYKDRFGLRTTLIRWYSEFYVFGLRTSPSDRVVLGRDDWLFYDGSPIHDGDPLMDYRGAFPFSRSELERWRWTLQDIHEWLEARGVKFLFVLVPGKGHLYPERLPGYLTSVHDGNPRQQVVDYLRAHTDVSVLDVTDALRQGKEQEQVFFRTDSHWNPYGTYCGYRAILDSLALWFPGLQPKPAAAFGRRVGTIEGDLSQMLSLPDVLAEAYPLLVPNEPVRAVVHPPAKRHRPDVVAEVNEPSWPSAVLMRDSFSEPLVPFLAEHFRRLLVRWNDHGFNARLVTTEQPDVVILEIGDRLLRAGYKYSGLICRDAAKRRFSEASKQLGVFRSAAQFREIEALSDVELDVHTDELVARGTGRFPHILLPPIEGAEAYVAILKLDVTAPVRTDLELLWLTDEPDGADFSNQRYTSAPLVEGRNEVYLALSDPDRIGPVRCDLGSRGGTFVIHEIEIKGFPRDADSQ